LDLLDEQDVKLRKVLFANGRPGFGRSPVPLSEMTPNRVAEMFQNYIPEKEYDTAKKDGSLLTDPRFLGLGGRVLSRSEYIDRERILFFNVVLNGLDTTLTISDQVYEPLREQVIYQLSDVSQEIQDLRELLQDRLNPKGEQPIEPYEYIPGKYSRSDSCLHPDNLNIICSNCTYVPGVDPNPHPKHPVA